MEIIIKETDAVETLSIIDPKSGVDYISDFVGNTGALIDGQFDWDEDRDAYVCDQETYNWWDTVVTANQSLVDRIHELIQDHGSETVYEVIWAAGSVDLEDHAANVNQALDVAFANVNAIVMPSSCVGCKHCSAGRWPGWSCRIGVPGEEDDYSCWEEDDDKEFWGER